MVASAHSEAQPFVSGLLDEFHLTETDFCREIPTLANAGLGYVCTLVES